MLAIPAKGFQRSIRAHNVDIAVCCDWLEASVCALDEPVSTGELIDALRENEIYATQPFAWEFAEDVWRHLRARSSIFGEGYPLIVRENRIQPKEEIFRFSPYLFCLTLSLPAAFPQWAKRFTDFARQGELFEKLTAVSVESSFTGWNAHLTGWTRTNPTSLPKVVKEVAELLGESIGDVGRWSKARAKEAGLDVLCYRAFPDSRVGFPVFLIQCASGADWTQKQKTPDLRLWCKIVDFAATPKKAFAMPFALEEKDFIVHTNIVDGLLLDRHRLLAPGCTRRDWVGDGLAAELHGWTAPRMAVLPRLEALQN